MQASIITIITVEHHMQYTSITSIISFMQIEAGNLLPFIRGPKELAFLKLAAIEADSHRYIFFYRAVKNLRKNSNYKNGSNIKMG